MYQCFRYVMAAVGLCLALAACQSSESSSTAVPQPVATAALNLPGLSDEQWEATARRMRETFFQALDADKSGDITVEEAALLVPSLKVTHLSLLNPEIDGNGDGRWQFSEFSDYKGKTAAYAFRVQELRRLAEVNWIKYDVDQSGTLKKDELLAMFDSTGRCKIEAQCTQPAIVEQTQLAFNQMDTDKNQIISYSEFQVHSNQQALAQALANVAGYQSGEIQPSPTPIMP